MTTAVNIPGVIQVDLDLNPSSSVNLWMPSMVNKPVSKADKQKILL